ncbi:MAG: 2-amino-4-hydroxy-6-hydroxymethyldihydropteridine diphosphokinase [Coxiellaceae bacterium]|nr:2-amino-4-hydroxy-6-hydroxymethyldihydropteridine diphosphokinase [Coxiellaceae bacterium]
MASVFLALGSNLGDSTQNISKAIALLKDDPGILLSQQSSFYRSQPLGCLDQPEYINAVVEVQTSYSPESLLIVTQAIEAELGRKRVIGQRWQSREMDIDIILYGSEFIQTPYLQIPHYAMKERAFVLYPLLEITPDLILPCGHTLRSCCDTLNQNDLEKLASSVETVI